LDGAGEGIAMEGQARFFSSIYGATPLNTTEIPQTFLNIENKSRSNPLSWSGQFSPQLIQALMDRYAKPRTTIFDPFLGSGTVLLEAGRAELTASGTEINPAAVVLSRTYKFINLNRDQRRSHLSKVQQLLHTEIPNNLPIFNSHSEQIEGKLDKKAIKSRLVRLLLTAEERPQHRLLETLIALLDFHKQDLSTNKIFSTWHDFSRLVIELPYSHEPIEVHHADARKTPLTDSSVDLVITSPPYVNVFNYHQQYRASMEELNWDLLKIARSEIGSNRKHRGNRFLTVIQYCLDLAQTFYEMARICHPKSRLIFVVGRESRVRGTRIFNGEIVAEIAHRVLGFDLILRQERVFLNRFGQNIFEDILHFSPPTSGLKSEFLKEAREVAGEVLEATYPMAMDGVKDDIKSAVRRIEAVNPSPIFNLAETLKN
jgi:hypothetical protein